MAKLTDKQLSFKKPADLIPYVNNSRTHSEEQITQVASSIKESWRFFPLNDCYAADDIGNIYSVCRRQKSKSGNNIEKYETTLLSGSIDKYGYKTYRIVINGKKKHIKGHRIVALSFYGESDKPCVNHIDGNKLNNSVYNLEYVTVAENNKHALDAGLWKKGLMRKGHKVLINDYVTIYILNKISGYSRAKLAEMNNVSRQTIDKVIRVIEPLLGSVTNAEL